ncbi:hypothetical protein D3C87_1967130 [compost metagenome]
MGDIMADRLQDSHQVPEQLLDLRAAVRHSPFGKAELGMLVKEIEHALAAVHALEILQRNRLALFIRHCLDFHDP